MEPSLAMQKALVARLKGASEVTDLVPAAAIFDSHERPSRFPCVIVGEDQAVREPLTLKRTHVTVYQTLHVWSQKGTMEEVKRISGAIVTAMRAPFDNLDGQEAVAVRHAGSRYVRHDDGALAHAIITFEAMLEEVEP